MIGGIGWGWRDGWDGDGDGGLTVCLLGYWGLVLGLQGVGWYSYL